MKESIFYHYSFKTQVLFAFLFILFSSFTNHPDKDYSNEKIYIQFDKPTYYTGEDIWFKTYLLDAETHTPNTLSKVVYAELISPSNEILETKTIKIIDGGGEGYFQLSPKLSRGEYTVRAYTNFMRNFDSNYFFRKKIFIETPKSKEQTNEVLDASITEKQNPDIQFFPEGGHLVNGFLNKVGFKAVGVNGKGIDVEGVITDANGKEILEIKTSKFGMGAFTFVPKKNSVYKLNIVHEGVTLVYSLPAATKDGVVMQIIERQNEYRITLQSSLNTRLNNCSFIGAQRSGVVFSADLAGNKGNTVINVPKSVLEQGIVKFTLVDNEKPLCERLVFFETDKASVNVNITPSKQEFETRELVKLEISLDSILQQKVKTNMSISVTDMSAVEPDPFGLEIRSQLLLNSELKGNIEKPGYYFNSDDPERKRNIDILMMTQGWRKYIDINTLMERSKPIFLAETDISISGRLKDFYNPKKPTIAEVSLTYNNSKDLVHEFVMTDTIGEFAFYNLNLLDTTSVFIQAKKIKNTKQSKKTKSVTVNSYIEIDSFVNPKITIKERQYSDEFPKRSKDINAKYLESLFNLQKGTVELDEVVLEADILDRDSELRDKRTLYNEASYTLDFKDIKGFPSGDLFSMLVGRIPGFTAQGSIRGNTISLFLLNGITTIRKL